jgi:signal transduction histidine kinase
MPPTQISVVFDLAPDLPPARADANQLELAILNLSVNAKDAMEVGGGTLHISAKVEEKGSDSGARLRPGRYICISVADTGAGMSKDVIDKAIEPFFSTKGIGKGTGLGLSMVHGLATQLGGDFVIDSHLVRVRRWSYGCRPATTRCRMRQRPTQQEPSRCQI